MENMPEWTKNRLLILSHEIAPHEHRCKVAIAPQVSEVQIEPPGLRPDDQVPLFRIRLIYNGRAQALLSFGDLKDRSIAAVQGVNVFGHMRRLLQRDVAHYFPKQVAGIALEEIAIWLRASRVSAIMRETHPVPRPTSNTRDPTGNQVCQHTRNLLWRVPRARRNIAGRVRHSPLSRTSAQRHSLSRLATAVASLPRSSSLSQFARALRRWATMTIVSFPARARNASSSFASVAISSALGVQRWR